MNHNSSTSDWMLYRGDHKSRSNWTMPGAPPWRPHSTDAEQVSKYNSVRQPLSISTQVRGKAYQAKREICRMVNAALHLRRPLLVTGGPGTGKSSLIEAVAWELELGEPLRWAVTSRSTLREGLYSYDAIGRAQGRSAEGAADYKLDVVGLTQKKLHNIFRCCHLVG